MFEKMSEWGLVKFFGSLINPDVLGKRIEKILELYQTNSFMRTAKRLIVWAVIIIIMGTVIDLALYWLRPEQKETLEKAKVKIVEYWNRITGKAPRGRKGKR